MKMSSWFLVVSSLALMPGLSDCALAQGVAEAAEVSATADASVPPGVLAIVNGVAIPLARLEDAVRTSQQADTPQLRKLFKEELIIRELVRQQAEKQGYGTKPEVQQAVDRARAAAASELYLRENMHAQPVTEAQIKARYDEIIGMMGEEEYKVRIISVADDATAQKVLTKLKEGVPFEALVHEYSVASSKEIGGEMPWFSFKLPLTEGKTQGVPLPVAKAVTHLKEGAATPEPIRVGDVRVIVKLDAKRATQVPVFDEVKDSIRQQLQLSALSKARTALVGELMQGAAIRQ